MLPWSVMPTAGWPSAAAVATTSSIRAAPSSIEYSVCRCRWTNDLRQRPLPDVRLRLVHRRLSTGLWMNHTGVVRRTCARRHARASGSPAARRPGAPASPPAVSEPWAETQLRLVGQRRVDEADAGRAPRARRRRRAGTWPAPGRARASPRRAAARAGTPTRRRRASSRRGREQVGRGARHARAGSGTGRRPRTSSTIGVERLQPEPPVRSEVDLAVVGGDEQRGVVGQRVEQRADEPVGGARARPGRRRRRARTRARPRRRPGSTRTRTARPPRPARRTCSTSTDGGLPAVEVGRRAGARR